MNDPSGSTGSRRPSRALVWLLVLPLAAGAALYARQQSALGAAQGQVTQLEADLDLAQAAARQLESRDATLEVQNAELGLRLTQVVPTAAPTQPSESEVDEGLLIPHCVLYASEDSRARTT